VIDHPDPYAEAAERFARETASHEMSVLHDDGLYRHLRFANPRYGALYRFDLVTWPNGLTIRGDGPTFVFSLYPLADLFDMFRGTSRDGINPGYWKEKVQAGQVRSWSAAKFRKWLTATAEAGEARHPGLVADITEQILDSDEHNLEYEDGARTAIAWFDHDAYELQFPATWEQNFDDWSWEYLWACHAIVRGIAAYDQANAEQPAPQAQGAVGVTVEA
jgi:hypothetical protein